MQEGCALLIFSDLDGTLLDHETYSFTPAGPALSRLARLGLPVVLASSKTAAEIAVVQAEMGLTGTPAIVENGAGVIGLDGPEAEARAYADLRRRLDRIAPELRAGFIGFGDMSDGEVAALTGLTERAAALARDRHFSEPGLWRGRAARRQDFLAALAQEGLHAREGGRFLTLSFGSTKQTRMAEIIARLAPAQTAALGDAPNDVEMLENVDYAFIIANPHRAPLPPLDGEATGRITRTELPGPEGWNAAVNGLLDRLELD